MTPKVFVWHIIFKKRAFILIKKARQQFVPVFIRPNIVSLEKGNIIEILLFYKGTGLFVCLHKCVLFSLFFSKSNSFQELICTIVPLPFSRSVRIAALRDEDHHSLTGAGEENAVGIFQI